MKKIRYLVSRNFNLPGWDSLQLTHATASSVLHCCSHSFRALSPTKERERRKKKMSWLIHYLTTAAVLIAIAEQKGGHVVEGFSGWVYRPVGRILATSSSPLRATESSSSSSNDFAAFADSLEEELVEETPTTTTESTSSWQAKLETLLDPRTGLAQRQILLSELLTANEEIRQSVLTALRDRKVKEYL